jgi:UDP-2,3-diacylglucosamine pyrophosphatase LpxH
MHGSRAVYVISDLHIGGEYGADNLARDDRGFRMCTRVDALTAFVDHVTAAHRAPESRAELVINGDFIDFLAEEASWPRSPGGRANKRLRTWKPFIPTPEEAIGKLGEIVKRDQGFFDALARLLASGHAITLLLGNHDVELSYPAVREALERHLGVTGGSDFKFLLDDEAYIVGDALIEHGNRYDGFNKIDHDKLREARARQSRGVSTEDSPFSPPPGSRLVSYVMNPIKEKYPFVDLLKPETESVLPILAALAPSVRWQLPRVLFYKAWASLRDVPRGVDVAAHDEDDDGEAPARKQGGARNKTAHQRDEEAFRSLLTERMTEAQADEFLRKLAAADPADRSGEGEDEGHEKGVRGRDVASPSPHLLRILGSVDPRGLHARLPALLDALRIVQNDSSFDVGTETEEAYLEAAKKIAKTGRRFVVFGHTHLAKKVDLGGDPSATYLNTGTWADLIEFPKKIFQPNDVDALAELAIFVHDLNEGDLQKYIRFKPSYARLDVQGDRVERADLCFWEG